VPLHQSDVIRQSTKTSHSHDGVVPANCHLNVPQNCDVSSGHASMPAQRLSDIDFDSRSRTRPCFQVHSVGSLMGNRLADCAVGGVSATTQPAQSMPAVVVTGSYRDCGRWPPAHHSSALLHHGKPTDWLSGQQLASASDVNRPAWISHHSPATMNGIDSTRNNYNAMIPSQVYARRDYGQIPRPYLPASIPASRLHAGSIPVNIRQIWMHTRPQQQQQQVVGGAGQNLSMSPVQNMSVVGARPSNASSVMWPTRFGSPSLSSAQSHSVPSAYVTVAAATECTSVASVADSHLVSDPHCSPVATSVTDSAALRNNTVGRIYQLPVATVAVTTGQCATSVASSSLVSSSVSSVTTSAQSAVSTKSAVKSPIKPAVITASPPDTERTYVAGRRYTITKEDGVTVEGIWDGKYLTVLPTSVSKSTASQTSG